MKHIINLGIFAHVDAGKTTLTEALLFDTHNTAHLGRVDDGTTVTDTMELERKRGITIKETTISFYCQDLKINLLDTPGHPDFIAEVERSLQVTNCAILVISAIEGIQAQTYKLFSVLKKHHIPTMIFVNKVDRIGFDYQKTIQSIKEKLTHQYILMQDENFCPADMHNQLLEFDDRLQEMYCQDKIISDSEFTKCYLRLLNQGKIYPVFFGSALRHLHTDMITNHLKDFSPVKSEETETQALVYKIKYINHHRYTYFKVLSGKIHKKDIFNGQKIRHLNHLVLDKAVECDEIESGDIGILIDDTNYHVFDRIGSTKSDLNLNHFQPTITTTVTPTNPDMRQEIISRLTEMNDEDPFLEFQMLPDGTLTLKLFGEIQKEVIQSQIPVTFIDSRIIYQETILKDSAFQISIRDKRNPWSAGLTISCHPLPKGSGLHYQSKVDFGYLKASFQSAVEQAVYQSGKEGLYGWQITDVLVVLEAAEFDSVTSTPADYRSLAPLVFIQSYIQGGVSLLYPVDRFELHLPYNYLSDVYYCIYKQDGVIEKEHFHNQQCQIQGMIPTQNSSQTAQEIIKITQGNSYFSSQYFCHEKTDKIISNPYRLLPDASNIQKYLLQKSGRYILKNK